MKTQRFEVDAITGRLSNSDFLPSPNCDARPDGICIDLLVIHNISLPPKVFGGNYIQDLFLNRLDPAADPFFEEIYHLKVSAHLLIQRDGHVVQFVPFTHRAWHAGESSYAGRTKCNDFSIGIELEGADDVPYTHVQYQYLSLIATQLIKRYPDITLDRIVGHQTIAPLRKTDPGPLFDWGYLFRLLEKEIPNEILNPNSLSNTTGHY